MQPVIFLNDFVEQLDMVSEEQRVFLNIRTGSFVMISSDDMMAAEVTSGEKTGEYLISDDFRELPDRYDLHEHAIMQRFCHTITDDELRRGLLRSLQGRGASMRIMNTVHQFGIEEKWSAFRNGEFREIAAQWLEKHGVAFAD